MLVVGSQSGPVWDWDPNGISSTHTAADRIVGNVNRGAITGSKVEFTMRTTRAARACRPSEK